MKKYFIGFIVGVIATCSIGVLAYKFEADQIAYEPSDKSWKVNNVKSAINDLKSNCSSQLVGFIASGDVNTVGSVVKINNEDFYVIGQGTGKENGKTKLITKKAINGNSVQANADYRHFSTSFYWANQVGDELKYPGSYSGSPYPYVYDSNSISYEMINSYVLKLKQSTGASNITGRLLTYEEAEALPNNVRDIDEYYWTGSAGDNQKIAGVNTEGVLWMRDALDGTLCTRPVILVPTNKIG